MSAAGVGVEKWYLGEMAAELGQGGRLLGVLDALGHRVEVQGPGQGDDGAGDRRLLRASGDSGPNDSSFLTASIGIWRR
jgi:hypothetical protein